MQEKQSWMLVGGGLSHLSHIPDTERSQHREITVQLQCTGTHLIPNGNGLLCRMVLEGPQLPHFFDLIEVANFEIASDAFTSFQVSL